MKSDAVEPNIPRDRKECDDGLVYLQIVETPFLFSQTKSKMTLIALQGYSMFRGAVLCLSEVASVQS